MADIGPVFIPAIAAIGGAGITAVGALLASRERYSQRIERLANVRDRISDNALLRVRIDRMIHHEISSASASKSTAFSLNLSISLILLSYLYAILAVLVRDKQDKPPIYALDSKILFWISGGILIVGSIFFFAATTHRNRITRSTLPKALSGAQIAEFARRQAIQEYDILHAPSYDEDSNEKQPPN